MRSVCCAADGRETECAQCAVLQMVERLEAGRFGDNMRVHSGPPLPGRPYALPDKEKVSVYPSTCICILMCIYLHIVSPRTFCVSPFAPI